MKKIKIILFRNILKIRKNFGNLKKLEKLFQL